MIDQHRIYQLFANIFIFNQHGLEHEADSDPHTNFSCILVNPIWIIQIIDLKASETGLGKDSDTRVRLILVFNITLTQSLFESANF